MIHHGEDPTGTERSKDPMVAVHTEYGTMKFILYDRTPKHRDNFLKLAKKGFFDGTTFHRVIKGFMIQGGDPHSKKDVEGKVGEGNPGYTLEAEIHEELFHRKGALSAARKGDQVNPEKRSNGSQFYIVHGKKYARKDLKRLEERIRAQRGGDFSFSEEQLEAYSEEGGAPHLDGSYTVFGRLVEGMEVLDKIAGVKVDPSKNRPKERVEMEVEVIE